MQTIPIILSASVSGLVHAIGSQMIVKKLNCAVSTEGQVLQMCLQAHKCTQVPISTVSTHKELNSMVIQKACNQSRNPYAWTLHAFGPVEQAGMKAFKKDFNPLNPKKLKTKICYSGGYGTQSYCKYA
jgi:hypothetical protein